MMPAGFRFIPLNVPVQSVLAHSSHWIQKISVTILRKVGARDVVVLASCFTCPTSSEAPGPKRLRSPGINGRKAIERFARNAKAHVSIQLPWQFGFRWTALEFLFR